MSWAVARERHRGSIGSINIKCHTRKYNFNCQSNCQLHLQQQLPVWKEITNNILPITQIKGQSGKLYLLPHKALRKTTPFRWKGPHPLPHKLRDSSGGSAYCPTRPAGQRCPFRWKGPPLTHIGLSSWPKESPHQNYNLLSLKGTDWFNFYYYFFSTHYICTLIKISKSNGLLKPNWFDETFGPIKYAQYTKMNNHHKLGKLTTLVYLTRMWLAHVWHLVGCPTK